MTTVVHFTLTALLCFTSKTVQSQSLRINHGPYLQYVTPTEATLVWTTNKNSMAWVEFYKMDKSTYYAKERPKVFAAEDGLKTIGKIHKVTLESLEPNTTYAYRIYAREVLEHKQQNSLFGETVATRVYLREPLYFTTLKTTPDEVNFVLLTDTHEKPKKIGSLLKNTNFNKTDFVIIDGDFMNNFDEEKNLFQGGLDTLTQIFAKEKPLYLVRGNHETRGVMGSQLKNYLHLPHGKYYYTFSYGDSFFIVLDAGEDKADSDIEYSSLAAFDSYRTKQANWLKKVLESEKFRQAKHKIVFSHIPPYGGSNWHGDIELQKKFVPLLNKAEIDIMICGHTHRYNFVPAKKGKNQFPILICDNDAKVNVTINTKGITATTIGLDKKVISTLNFK